MDEDGASILVLAQDTPTTMWRPAKGVYIGQASKLAIGSIFSYFCVTTGWSGACNLLTAKSTVGH